MAIKIYKKFKHNGITWKSGHFYTFRYNAYRQDPHPVVLCMYKVYGIHPTTGHQHNYIQALNYNYVPRSQRKVFINMWRKEMDKNKNNVEMTWDLVQFRFPYLDGAVRRYMLKPVYRIQKAQYIPPENLEDIVVSTWSKDFSKKLNIDLALKKARAMDRGATLKKKYKSKWGGFFNTAKKFFW